MKKQKTGHKQIKYIIGAGVILATVIVIALLLVFLKPAKIQFISEGNNYEIATIANLKKGIATPKREGYDFINWYYDVDGVGREVKFETLPHKSRKTIKVYAKWETKEYNINLYNKSNEKPTAILKIKYDSVYPTAGIPILDKYDFKGYFTKENGKGEMIFDRYGFPTKMKDGNSLKDRIYKHTNNINLYAFFTNITTKYQVIFIGHNGKILQRQEVLYSKNAIAPTNIEVEGYTFEKWDTSLDDIRSDTTITAVYSNKDYILKYNALDGVFADNTSIKEITHKYEQEIKAPLIPTKKGHKFLGFFTKQEGGEDFSHNIYYNFAADVEIYARYQRVKYNVTLNLPDGATSPITNFNIEYNGDLPPNISIPDKKGYIFKGFFTNSGHQYFNEVMQPMSKWMLDRDGELNAKFEAIKYKIIYDLKTNDAVLPSDAIREYTIEDSFSLTTPSRIGYKFISWTDENNNAVSTVAKGSNRDAKLTANWQIINYNINYILGPALDISANRINYNIETERFTLKPLTAVGYKFINFEEGNSVEKGSIGDKTFTAKFEVINYNINYVLDGGKNSSKNKNTYTIEDEFEIFSPRRDGYTFIKWLEGSKIQLTDLGDKTFTALWQANDYNITYNLDGGINSQENFEGYSSQNKEIVIKNPSKRGYSFVGWTSSEVLLPTINLKIAPNDSGDKVFTAHFELINYNIKYNLNNGGKPSLVAVNAADNPTTYTVIDNVQLLPPTRKGYTFNGWEEVESNLISNNIGEITLTAKWTPNTYTIDYSLQEGESNSLLNPISYTVDMDNILLSSPSKSGYKFKNWKSEDDLHIITEINVLQATNLKIIPKYEEIIYSITYFSTTDSENASLVKEFTITSNDIILPDLIRGTSIFAGWIGSGIKDPIKGLTIKKGTIGNKTYTAIFLEDSYTISFNANTPTNESLASANPIITVEGTTSNQNFIINEQKQLHANNYSLKGHKFLGWSLTREGSVKYIDQTVVSQLSNVNNTIVELFAVWEPIKYNIKYSLDGAVPIDNIKTTYTMFDNFKLPIPEKTGYTFESWYGDFNGTNADHSMVDKLNTGNLNINARFRANKYNVIFNNNGGTGDTQLVATYDMDMPKINKPYKKGYIFIGYYSENNALGVQYYDFEAVSLVKYKLVNDLTLYAHYIENTYQIVYKAEKPVTAVDEITFSMSNTIAKYDSSFSLESNKYRLKGWTFKGWAKLTDKESVIYTDGQKVSNLTSTNNEIVELYAVWGENKYTISYAKNKPATATGEVSGVMPSNIVSYNDTINLRDNEYQLNGWVFKNWIYDNKNYNNQEQVTKLVTDNNANVILKAIWGRKSSTVMFNHDNGEGNTEKTIEFDDQLPKISSIVREGYSFDGYYFNERKIYDKNFSPIIQKWDIDNVSVTLTAKWNINSYTIEFNSNKPANATNEIVGQMDNILVKYNQSLRLPNNKYSLNGWDFKGWVKSKSSIEANFNNEEEIINLSSRNETISLHALWVAKTINVTLQSCRNATPQTATIRASYDEILPISNLEVPTRNGWKLMGYYEGENGLGEKYIDENFKAINKWNKISEVNITIYAYWQILTYEIINNEITITGLIEDATPEAVLEIPSTIFGVHVTSIKERSFDLARTPNISNVTQINLPNTIKKIGIEAFRNITANIEFSTDSIIDTITINSFKDYMGKIISLPISIKHIEDKAFNGTKNLESFSVNGPLETLGAYVLTDNRSLINFKAPFRLYSNGNFTQDLGPSYYFSNKDNSAYNALPYTIKKFEILPSDKIVTRNAFIYQSEKEIIIPKEIETIENGAFSHTTNLKLIFEENSKLKSVNDQAFLGFNSTHDLILPESIQRYGAYVFYQMNIYGVAKIPTRNLLAPKTINIRSSYIKKLFLGEGIESLSTTFIYSVFGELILPNTLTRIKGTAIANITIEELNLPDGITIIEDYAISGKIGKLKLPSGLIEFGNQNNGIGEYYIATTNTHFRVEGFALYSYDYKTIHALGLRSKAISFDLNSATTNIRPYAFSKSTLEIINLNNVLTKVGQGAFSGSLNLHSANFPDTLEIVERDAFARTKLALTFVNENDVYKNITMSQDTKKYIVSARNREFKIINDAVYSKDGHILYFYPLLNGKTSYTIAAGTKEIYKNAFVLYANRSLEVGLENIILPDGLLKISDAAFYNNYHLESINLPNSIRHIGANSLVKNKITHIRLPNSLTHLSKSAFDEKITKITIPSDVNITNLSDGFNIMNIDSIELDINNTNYKYENGILYNGDYSTLYMTTKNINQREITLNNNTRMIANNAFVYRKMIYKIISNSLLEKIGQGAFAYSSIKYFEHTSPSILNEIAALAFSNSEIKEFVIPDSVTKLGNSVFNNAINLSVVTIGKNVNLGSSSQTFSDARSLHTVSFNEPSSTTNIGDFSFQNTFNLYKINFPNSLSSLNSKAFVNTSVINLTILADNVNLHDISGFSRFANLKNIYIKSTKIDNIIGSSNITDTYKIIVSRSILEDTIARFPNASNVLRPDKVVVKFVTNVTGETIEDQLINYGDSITIPAQITLPSNKIFKGWYMEQELINIYILSAQVLNDMTLYARIENA